jgi:hypothetical protein
VAKLIYSAIASLDGYVADENGNFDWAAPDEELHRVVNDLERSIGTYLYGAGRTAFRERCRSPLVPNHAARSEPGRSQ